MEIGEAVTVPEFLTSADHNESTCPWHAKGDASASAMGPTDPDDDSAEMPANDGGKLGRNMNAAGDTPPAADTVEISYKPGTTIVYQSGKKQKTVLPYESTGDENVTETYGLQYAPHHLVPGNESLKGSAVVPFLGDDDVIANFKGSTGSHIKKGKSVGYDVNRAENGVWLPSPYALSMANRWPGEGGVKVLKKRKLLELATDTEEFHDAYVAASIEASGGRQFHMRHNKYSDKVGEILKAIGAKLKLMAGGRCSIAAGGKENGKFDPPLGLGRRLDVLSKNLRNLLIGDVWRDPIYTDKLTQKYTEDMKLDRTKAKGNIDGVV